MPDSETGRNSQEDLRRIALRKWQGDLPGHHAGSRKRLDRIHHRYGAVRGHLRAISRFPEVFCLRRSQLELSYMELREGPGFLGQKSGFHLQRDRCKPWTFSGTRWEADSVPRVD